MIYRCIIMSVNCHEYLYEYCKGFNVVLCKMLVWVLQRICCCVILNAKLLHNVCMSIMKGLILCFSEGQIVTKILKMHYKGYIITL